MNLQLAAGYFSVSSPFTILDRWLNPYHVKDSIDIRGKKLLIMYTKRAEHALKKRSHSLIAELQLYFTCVVQKHVVFHQTTEMETHVAKNNLEIAFHTVQSESCDPTEFASNHPVKKELNSKGAQAMRPSVLKIDYKHEQWIGNFSI